MIILYTFSIFFILNALQFVSGTENVWENFFLEFTLKIWDNIREFFQ